MRKSFTVFLEAVSVLLSFPPTEIPGYVLPALSFGNTVNTCDSLLPQCGSEFKQPYSMYTDTNVGITMPCGFLGQKQIEQVVI